MRPAPTRHSARVLYRFRRCSKRFGRRSTNWSGGVSTFVFGPGQKSKPGNPCRSFGISPSRWHCKEDTNMGNTVTVNGIKLAWEERGAGAPLVLIMGLGADRSAWAQHARAWERQFRCILVDNRGAGESDHPAGPYSTAQMADDYAGLITALGLRAVQVVGI